MSHLSLRDFEWWARGDARAAGGNQGRSPRFRSHVKPNRIIMCIIMGRRPSMQTLKLTAVGTSTGAVIPKEMLTRLKVEKGDSLFAIETAEGYLPTPDRPAVRRPPQGGPALLEKFRETFKALAE